MFLGTYLNYVVRGDGIVYLTSDGSFAQKEKLAFDVLMVIGAFNVLEQGVTNTEMIIEKLINKFSISDNTSSFITFKTVEDAETFIYFFDKFFGTYVRSEKSILFKKIKKFFKRLVG